jgi:hypothetical protein
MVLPIDQDPGEGFNIENYPVEPNPPAEMLASLPAPDISTLSTYDPETSPDGWYAEPGIPVPVYVEKKPKPGGYNISKFLHDLAMAIIRKIG